MNPSQAASFFDFALTPPISVFESFRSYTRLQSLEA